MRGRQEMPQAVRNGADGGGASVRFQTGEFPQTGIGQRATDSRLHKAFLFGYANVNRVVLNLPIPIKRAVFRRGL
jgi:hypothetical protein